MFSEEGGSGSQGGHSVLGWFGSGVDDDEQDYSDMVFPSEVSYLHCASIVLSVTSLRPRPWHSQLRPFPG